VARIRSVKPELFFDEELASRDIWCRYFFIGLFNQADKAGRMEDRPARLKANIYPYDEFDAERALTILSPKFIRRYEVEGRNYIQINAFSKHQRPHHTEADSIIPPPPKHDNGELPVKERLETAGVGVGVGGGVGVGECSGGKKSAARTVPMPEELAKTMPSLRRVRLDNPGELFSSWSQAYPDVGIVQELLKCDAWAVTKKVTRSARGWARTMNTWLSKEQDKRTGEGRAKSGQPLQNAKDHLRRLGTC